MSPLCGISPICGLLIMGIVLLEENILRFWVYFQIGERETRRGRPIYVHLAPNSRHGKTGQTFLTRPKKYLTRTPFFLTRPMFFLRVNPNPNPNPNLFLKKIFLVKKIVKLRQYWFNCLLWALKKQLIHLHNCMQINWKINACGWAFCNE